MYTQFFMSAVPCIRKYYYKNNKKNRKNFQHHLPHFFLFLKYHFGSRPCSIGITLGHCFIKIGIAHRTVIKKYSGNRKYPIKGRATVPENCARNIFPLKIRGIIIAAPQGARSRVKLMPKSIPESDAIALPPANFPSLILK